jgi:serine/threonine protein kinase
MEEAVKVYRFLENMEVDSKYGYFYLVEKEGVKYVAKVVSDPKVIGWLQKTVQDQLKFNHPNVVRVIDVFKTPNQWCLVYEYCAKGDLFELAIIKKVPSTTLIKYFRDVLKGLTYLHELGYVHQDIKGENIFVDANDVAKIGDFDMLTRSIDYEGMSGTAHYVAPETILRQPRHSPVDMWALGVTIYSLITSTILFDAQGSKLSQLILQGVVDYRRLSWNLTDEKAKEVEHLLKKLLKQNPEERIKAREALAHSLFSQN